MVASNNLYDQQSLFWKEYLEARPQVPDCFFSRILGYHAEHGGHFGTLHDAGAGPGVHTARLSKRFQQILVSDASKSNISIARTHLEKEGNCSFRIARLEDADGLEPASMDMVFATNVLHFTDVDEAIEAITYQLKPGGTFVAAATGILALRDPDLNEMWFDINRRLDEIYLDRDETRQGWIRLLSIFRSSYDSIPVDSKHFLPHAQRIKLGRPFNWHGIIPSACDSLIPSVSRVGEDDEIVIEDNDEWDIDIDMNGIRKVFDTYRFDVNKDTKLASLWNQLEESIGASNVPACWPSLLILATKR